MAESIDSKATKLIEEMGFVKIRPDGFTDGRIYLGKKSVGGEIDMFFFDSGNPQVIKAEYFEKNAEGKFLVSGKKERPEPAYKDVYVSMARYKIPRDMMRELNWEEIYRENRA